MHGGTDRCLELFGSWFACLRGDCRHGGNFPEDRSGARFTMEDDIFPRGELAVSVMKLDDFFFQRLKNSGARA